MVTGEVMTNGKEKVVSIEAGIGKTNQRINNRAVDLTPEIYAALEKVAFVLTGDRSAEKIQKFSMAILWEWLNEEGDLRLDYIHHSERKDKATIAAKRRLQEMEPMGWPAGKKLVG